MEVTFPTSSEALLHHFLFFIFTIMERKKKISLCTFFLLTSPCKQAPLITGFLAFLKLLRSALHLQVKFSILTVFISNNQTHKSHAQLQGLANSPQTLPTTNRKPQDSGAKQTTQHLHAHSCLFFPISPNVRRICITVTKNN